MSLFGGILIKEAAGKFRDAAVGNGKTGGQNKIKERGKAAFSWAIWCLLNLWCISLRDVSAGRGREMDVVQAEVIGKAGAVGLAAVRSTLPT